MLCRVRLESLTYFISGQFLTACPRYCLPPISRHEVSQLHSFTTSERKLTSVDDDWKQFPVAECYELDALCDRFELAFVENPATRIEQFAVGLPQPQQRLIVRELVQLEIEQRRTRGESPVPDEYATRFPQWAEEIRALAQHTIEDLERSRIATLDTIDQKSGSDNDTKTSEDDWDARWRDQWQASWDAIRHADLPTDGVLGHYRLQSVIGRGGMGLVVRAHDTKLTRDVAIKILAIAISQDDTVHERFLREARAVAVIRHNHVVTIYAVEEIGRIPFLVMELVEGTTLDEYLRENGKLAASEIASLAYQMAQGLAAAHKQSLIHRDLKPANILLEKIDPHVNGLQPLSTWLVKITDFGLARVAAEVRLTSSGLIAGTPQYMSPEQANGQEIDMRSDLFSLGSVMYAMCAGQAAFQADSALGILRQVAEKPARSLREVSPQTPVWLIAIIEKLIAKSPDERFQSAAEVAELLSVQVHELQFGKSSTDLATNGKVAVDAAPTGTRTRVRSRTARLLALAIAGVAIGVFGIAMFFRHDGFEADVKQDWYDWSTGVPQEAAALLDATGQHKNSIAGLTTVTRTGGPAYNEALKFGGGSAPLTILNNGDFCTSTFTVEMYVRLDDEFADLTNGPKFWPLLDFYSQDPLCGYRFQAFEKADDLGLSVKLFDGQNGEWAVALSLDLQDWKHVAMAFDGTSVILYADGVELLNERVPPGTYQPSTSNLKLGGAGLTIDEVRLFNVARTADEIKGHMNRRISPQTPNLVAYFPFDNVSGK